MSSRNLLTFLVALAALTLLPACSIDVKDKKNNGGESRVDINTPIGNIHVNEQPDIRETGLSLYPGAQPAPKDDKEDKKTANVNISGPGFMLKVVAAEFVSTDSTDKVISYYEKELQRYGKVIQCHERWNGGSHTSDIHHGKEDSKPVSCSGDSSGSSVELKVGTEDDQHVVAIDKDGSRTKFALVYVRAKGKDDTI